MIEFLSKKLWWELFLRYALGTVMMVYGIIKLAGIQFVLPPPVYDYPLKGLDGVTLTWAFLGFSPWFSFLLGVFELVPALLLLFNRTKLWGIIFLFPVLLSVFLVNIAYGFLAHMQVLTGVLLLMNVLLLVFHCQALLEVMRTISQGRQTTSPREVIFNLIWIALIVILILLAIGYL